MYVRHAPLRYFVEGEDSKINVGLEPSNGEKPKWNTGTKVKVRLSVREEGMVSVQLRYEGFSTGLWQRRVFQTMYLVLKLEMKKHAVNY